MLDRRKFLKVGAALTDIPLIPSISAAKSVEVGNC